MSKSLRQTLCDLVAYFGLNIVNDPRRCKAYLLDYCSEQRRGVYALIAAQEEKIPARILSALKTIPQGILITQFTAHLVDSRPLDPAIARWAVESWILALGKLPAPGLAHIWDDDEESPGKHSVTKPPAPAKTPAAEKTKPSFAPSKKSTLHPTIKKTTSARPVPQSQPATSPFPLEASARLLDFGMLHNRNTPTTRTLDLRNPQVQGTLYGTVRSTLPWLEITPGGFACPPHQPVHLTAQLTPVVARLAPKCYQIPDAIIIESGQNTLQIGVRLEIAGTSRSWQQQTCTEYIPQPVPAVPNPPQTPPEPAPQAPLRVDFGVVSGKATTLPEQDLYLPNPHTDRDMTGSAYSTLPWLEVTPGGFVCAPGETVRLTIKITQVVSRLRPKTYDIPDALIIQSNGQTNWVGIHLTIVAG